MASIELTDPAQQMLRYVMFALGEYSVDDHPYRELAESLSPRMVKNSTQPAPSRHVRSIMKDNKWVRLLAYITGMVDQRLLL